MGYEWCDHRQFVGFRFNGSLVSDVFMIAGSKTANTSWVLTFSSGSSRYWKA